MQMIRNMGIRTKTIIPMIGLIIMVAVTGIGGIFNTSLIMDASLEISHVHFTNVYNLEELNYNFEVLQRVVYAHCVCDNDETMRSLETEIDTTYNRVAELMESLSVNMTEGTEMKELFDEFQSNYGTFMTHFTTAIEYSASGKTTEAAKLANAR